MVCPGPSFHDEIVTDDKGQNGHKICLGMERLGLPVAFPNLSVGRERVAKQVLGRLQSRTKTGES